MIRFLRLWITFWLGYAIIGYLVVGALYLIAMSGWSDGPSSGRISADVPEKAQQIYSFGVFKHPSLEPILFIKAGKPPWISRTPTEAEQKKYETEIQIYYQHVQSAKARSTLIYLAWVSLVSVILTFIFIVLQKNRETETIEPGHPLNAATRRE
jgi:hypothetical protein